MMTHKEIHHQLPDYVLGLLSPNQADKVAQHLASCAACRRSVLGEREIGALVRDTLNVTTRPDTVRMSQLMPVATQQAGRGKSDRTRTGRLVPALVVLFVILGSFMMSIPESKRPMSLFMAATATATSTNTPTATIAQETDNKSVQSSFVPERRSSGMPDFTAESPAPELSAPVPLLSATPVVANSQMAAN